MKLFITGGSSYLGQHMVPYLVSRGHEVCHTWFTSPPVVGFPGTGVQVDMRQRDQLLAAVNAFRPDGIIHLAASNRSPSEHEMIDSIVQGAKFVAEAARSLNCRLIFMSTDVVFDGTQAPYREGSPHSPIHAYGRAKADAENIISNEVANSVIIRPSLIYSLTIKDRSTEWIEASLKAGKSVTLFTDQIRMPVWVDTLSGACLELIKHDFCGILHVVGDQRLSRTEFGFKMLDWWGITNRETLAVAPTPAEANWPKDTCMDISLAKHILQTPLLGVDKVMKEGAST